MIEGLRLLIKYKGIISIGANSQSTYAKRIQASSNVNVLVVHS